MLIFVKYSNMIGKIKEILLAPWYLYSNILLYVELKIHENEIHLLGDNFIVDVASSVSHRALYSKVQAYMG